jgi:hypothetical protein
MRILLVLPMIALTGCLASRMQSMQSQGNDSSSSRFDPAQRLSPTAFEQNATMRDSSVHEDPRLLKVGVSRNKIIAAFGTPNQISNEEGQEQDVYEFNPGWFKIRRAENLRTQYSRRSIHGRDRDGRAPGQNPSHRAAAHRLPPHLRIRSDCAICS